MALAKFYHGTYSDLTNKEYEDGVLYFIFPDSQSFSNGHIYIDKDGIRKEISSAYNDTNILARLAELERVSLVHCTGLSIDSEKQTAVDSILGIVAMLTPSNVTDQIFWTSSDSTILTISDTTYDAETGAATAYITPQQAGTASINISCGNYNGSCLVEVIDANWYVDYILASEYSPDGESFFYQAPISLSDGQYIEAKIDLNGVNAIKQNLLSIGENIDKFTESRTPKIHIYSSQTLGNKKTHLRFAFIYTTNKSGIEYAIPNTNGSSIVTIKLDHDGLWINDTAFVCPDNTGKAIYETIMEVFRGKSSFDLGSQEGVNRSTAYYDYIKYVKYEPTI